MDFSKLVLKWFDRFGRHDLPWQKKVSAYRVWISEIMLQQTQVATAIPYFHQFLKRFPTVKSLALAKLDEVLLLWSGLGYYARARNLHKTAKLIDSKYNGRFPRTIDALSSFPGIGRSTAGAILSLGMNIPASILDGNVKRVLARYFAINEPINQQNTIKKLWLLTEKQTPKTRCADYNQAMMDIGATVCTRTKPKCALCPLQKKCEAYATNNPTQYPAKKIKTQRPAKKIHFLILQNNLGEILMEKRAETGIWGGLWSFPECEIGANIETWCLKNLAMTVRLNQQLIAFTHQFSHFELEIQPLLFQVTQIEHQIMDNENRLWYKVSQSLPGGVSAPVNRIINELRLQTHE